MSRQDIGKPSIHRCIPKNAGKPAFQKSRKTHQPNGDITSPWGVVFPFFSMEASC